jgi:threonine/homoserine/homoserine lactone efflux protein
MGSFFLIFLGSKMIFNRSKRELIKFDKKETSKGFFEGFMISFFNPKILMFFTAVFSQFMADDLTLVDKIILATVAGAIDITWYVFVAIILAGTKVLHALEKRSIYIDKITGYILLILGILMLLKQFIDL